MAFERNHPLAHFPRTMLHRLAPLRVRLPLTVALLLTVCIAVVLSASYRSVRQSVGVAAADRLHSAGIQISSMLEPSIRRSQGDAQRVSRRPEILDWLRGGSADKARPYLDSVLRASPQNSTLALTRRSG